MDKPHDHHHDGHEDLGYFINRTQAIEALLIDKGVITAAEVQAAVADMESRNPALGARVVARAWSDPAFKARLLADVQEAVAELGIDVGGFNTIVALENTDRVHHVVVCTLCSCYPRAILGFPPDWYKSLEYRSRVAVDPRGVLKEFGLELDPEVEVRVFDSTADLRYLVVPARPPGTEHMSEAELATLITRESMIGVGKALSPAAA